MNEETSSKIPLRFPAGNPNGVRGNLEGYRCGNDGIPGANPVGKSFPKLLM